MKTVKNFVQLKVPDNSAYEQRVYSEQWHSQEDERVMYRRLGAICSLVALTFYGLSLHLHAYWTRRQEQIGWSSLWDSCFLPPTKENSTLKLSDEIAKYFAERRYPPQPLQPIGQHDESTHLTCFQYIENWQKAVIGLLLFAIIFAFIGSILSVAGVCVQYIPKKMYYYHSSGEMFFVSAVSSSVALALYPYTVTKTLKFHDYQFGYGYILAWGATALLYVSAVTMMMDELIRESTQPRLLSLLCFKQKPRRQQMRRPQQQPQAV